MAKNKRPQDRQEKCDEIVVSAQQLFLELGYDATAMSRLATAAGIAPNTIYWYFKDKDDVLVAVLNRIVLTHLQEYQEFVSPNLADKVMWLLSKLEQASDLISTVHARTRVSESIAQWHDNFHILVEALFKHELLCMGLPSTEIDLFVKIFTFSIEGMLTHSMTTSQKQRICEILVNQLVHPR